jgi:ribonuclease R
VHEGPTPERLTKLRDFLGTFGFQLAGGDTPKAQDYAKLLEKIGQRPDRQLLQTVMLRSLRQAIYSPDNVGHFGLAYESYTHFTSPIRRYPDLLVHRAIKSALAARRYEPTGGGKCVGGSRPALLDDRAPGRRCHARCRGMAQVLLHEGPGRRGLRRQHFLGGALRHLRRARWRVRRRPGPCFRTRADYFHFDEKSHAMVGERSGRRFRLSDRVRVQLTRVDMEANKIDFRLADTAPARSNARH